MPPEVRRFHSIAAKLSIFSALLVLWVIAVVLLYDLRAGQFSIGKACLLSTITLLAAGAMARFAVRTLVRPFVELQQALGRVAEGDLKEIRVAATGDEIELLGHSFNAMIRALASSQAQVSEYRGQLEARIGERTVQLEEAMRRAQTASQIKSEFLANMSHELRTPMGGLIGMLDLMQQGTVCPETSEELRTAQSCAQSLLALLNDILDISKIEAGRMALEEIPFELAPLVEDCCKTHIVAAQEKRIGLRWSVNSTVPRHLVGDPLRLRQILINLVSNAVKFTSHGSVDVEIRGYERDTGDGPADKPYTLMIAVSDTGPGIPREKQEAIFDKFTQADGSISRRYGGTGLGLTITQRLVELHEGTIALESIPGRGSHFTVLLPCRAAAQPAGKTPAPVKSQETANRAEGPRKILVVEDNTINQRVITALLHKAGYEVDLAHHGQHALEQLAERRYDLVLMDVQMPVMDGLETTRRIRADARLAGLPVVALTAHAMSGDREKCLAAGMNGYLAKPVDHRHLLSVAAHYLRSAEPQAGVTEQMRSLCAQLAPEQPVES